MTDDSHKLVHFYKLNEILDTHEFKPHCTHRAFKKINALVPCSLKDTFTGLLLADKTGEIGFINLANYEKMPAPDAHELKESVEYADQPYYKTLYGHQETCLGLRFLSSGKRLVSWDTLNKITVTGWPNVFNFDSQLLEHKSEVTHVCALEEDEICSISGSLKS